MLELVDRSDLKFDVILFYCQILTQMTTPRDAPSSGHSGQPERMYFKLDTLPGPDALLVASLDAIRKLRVFWPDRSCRQLPRTCSRPAQGSRRNISHFGALHRPYVDAILGVFDLVPIRGRDSGPGSCIEDSWGKIVTSSNRSVTG